MTSDQTANREGGAAVEPVVVLILHSRFLLTSGSAVVGVQCEKEGAEHTARGSSSVEHQHRAGVSANLNSVWSAYEEVLH